jgi:hypothetical protein
MGHTIWVEVHGRPLKETADDSSTMHRLMDNLDVLAGKLGVRKLSDFYDYSELEEAYGDLSDEGEDTEDGGEEESAPEPTLEERQAKGEWFDSAVGLDSVRKLRQRLTERFDDLGFKPDRSTAHWPKQLLDELSHTEAILNEAASRAQRFRLLIVP